MQKTGTGIKVNGEVKVYEEANILEYTNPTVKEIYEKMGDFLLNNDWSPDDDGVQVREEEVKRLENGEYYAGEWDTSNNLRHGRGT